MLSQNIEKKKIINERSTPLQISPKSTLSYFKDNIFRENYTLKENFFDPSKMSPPNQFLLNLNKRMETYSVIQNKNKGYDN